MVVFTKNYKGKTLKIVDNDTGIDIYVGDDLVVILDTFYPQMKVHIFDEEQEQPIQTLILFV